MWHHETNERCGVSVSRLMTRSRIRFLLVGALALAMGWFAFWRNGTPRFEPAPCWFTVAVAAACGHLVVREVRGDLFSAEIRLPVVRLMPQGGDAPTDPILFINGGPGGNSGLDEAGIEFWSHEINSQPWMRPREMILMDQRGSGLAAPNLNCPEVDAKSFRLAYELNGQEQTAWSELEAASDACRDRLVGEGRRFIGYNSVAAAQDVADLQALLGIKALNVYGSSYGTRIALILMRDHPEGLRSVILESVLPPDADFLLQQQGGLPRVIERVAADLSRRCGLRSEIPGPCPSLCGSGRKPRPATGGRSDHRSGCVENERDRGDRHGAPGNGSARALWCGNDPLICRRFSTGSSMPTRSNFGAGSSRICSIGTGAIP